MDNLLREINFGQNLYCGPSALSAITGMGTDECASMLTRVSGKPRIAAIDISYMIQALEQWRYKTEQVRQCNGATLYFTLVTLLSRGDGVYLVQVPGHFITIEIKDKQPYICDNHTRSVISANASARLMQKIIYVYQITPRKEPKLVRRRVIVTEGYNNINIKVKDEYEDSADDFIHDAGYIKYRNKEDRDKIKLALLEAL